jgi:poly(A) polymerase
VPGSRLFDEMIKLLQTGHAIASVHTLRELGLIDGVFPILQAVLGERPQSGVAAAGSAGSAAGGADGADGAKGDQMAAAGSESSTTALRDRLVDLALRDTDRRVAEGRAVAPSFLLACLLWHEVQSRWQALREAGESPFPALQQAIDAVFDARVGDISGRGRLAADMREIWQMQPRLERRSPASALSMLDQPRFRAGFDFLRLRADAGDALPELAEWWEDLSLGSDEDREAMLQDLRSAPARRGAARRAAPAPASRERGGATASVDARAPAGDAQAATPDEAAPSFGQADASSQDVEADAAPRKRRRRRRSGSRQARDGGTPDGEGAGG